MLHCRSKEYIQTAPTKRNALYYNMKHPKRGKALIFNHDFFSNNKLQRRGESKIDCQNLSDTLKRLGFDIKVYDNLKHKEIVKTLEKGNELMQIIKMQILKKRIPNFEHL